MEETLKKEKGSWIPDEIKKVERPQRTCVKRSSNHFYVITRTSKLVIGKDGKRRIPVETGRLGKIENGKYIPMPEVSKGEEGRTQGEANEMNYGNVEIKA